MILIMTIKSEPRGNDLKLGIIGLGNVHSWQAEALRAENILVPAVCDKNPRKADLYPKTNFLTEPTDLLNLSQVDAVLVAVPNKEHFTVAKTAIEAGKDVLLEKPATSSLSELEELYKLADARGVKLVIAFHAAFAADLEWYLRNSEMIDKGKKIVTFRCNFYDPYADGGKVQPQAIKLGGSWTDSGVNALSVICKILPELRIVSRNFMPDPNSMASELQATVDFNFPVEKQEADGSGVIKTDWTRGINHKSTRLTFSDNRSVILDHSEQTISDDIPNQGDRKPLVDFSAGYPRLTTHYIGVFRDFMRHLKNGTDNRDFAFLVHRLLFDAMRDDLPKSSSY